MAEITGVSEMSPAVGYGTYARAEEAGKSEVIGEVLSAEEAHNPDIRYESQAPLFERDQRKEEERENARKNHGYNLSLAMVELHTKYFDYKERALKGYLGQISSLNLEIETINKFSNLLSQNREKGKVDFAEDPEAKELIDKISEKNAAIFKSQYLFKTEADFDNTSKALDGLLNTKATALQEIMMYVQNEYEDRAQMTDQARKTIDMGDQHIKSILSKTRN